MTAAARFVAEAVQTRQGAIFGLRYPATDIPKQARALYVENPIRLIADVSDETASQSSAMRRILSPACLISREAVCVRFLTIHLEYLRNMGVASSMSISIIVNGELWGLIACHHDLPHRPAMSQRNSALLFGQMLSLIIQMRESAEEKASDQSVVTSRRKSRGRVAAGAAVFDVLVSAAGGFMEFLKADGYAVVREQAVVVPRLYASRGRNHADRHAAERSPRKEGFSHRPPRQFHAGGGEHLQMSHPACLPFRFRNRRAITCCSSRREQARLVKWAGNPREGRDAGPDGARLTPRKSFDAWQETVLCEACPGRRATFASPRSFGSCFLKSS